MSLLARKCGLSSFAGWDTIPPRKDGLGGNPPGGDGGGGGGMELMRRTVLLGATAAVNTARGDVSAEGAVAARWQRLGPPAPTEPPGAASGWVKVRHRYGRSGFIEIKSVWGL